MSFDITALNAFRNANLGGEKAIANLGQDDDVVKKNTYYGFIGKVFRGGNAKAANNAIRTELLRARSARHSASKASARTARA